MISNPNKQWLGLEYFCQENDQMWIMSDTEMQQLAARELQYMGFIKTKADIDDISIIRVKKAYPAYFGTYKDFDTIKNYLNNFANLYPIGRNGMHRYNNMDHSMLTAMLAVELMTTQNNNKEILWSVNSEEEYHEQAK